MRNETLQSECGIHSNAFSSFAHHVQFSIAPNERKKQLSPRERTIDLSVDVWHRTRHASLPRWHAGTLDGSPWGRKVRLLGMELLCAHVDAQLELWGEPERWPAVAGEKMHFSEMHFSKICKFLAGSFSAVSKRNFARKYAFDSIFQALQDLHPFAPL